MHRLARARSPAKLILSGEHAVVYGKPALAMATQFYTESVAEMAGSKHIGFRLPQLQYAKQVTLATLQTLKNRVQQDYKAFLAGQCGIRAVLKKPAELIQFTVANLLELKQVMTQPVNVQTHSTIPMGCGMGSSAALVMSALKAMGALFELSLDDAAYCQLGLEAERLQHGYSSGLDIQLVWQGGCLYFKEGQASPRLMPTIPLYGVNTGQPLSTTGDCVMSARVYFMRSTIANDFEAVTNALDVAFSNSDIKMIQHSVQENHRLLSRIGVVPAAVCQLIADLEQAGAAAKICGAGAVIGDKAGMVLVIPENLEAAEAVVQSHGLRLDRIQGDPHGTVLC